MPKKSPSEFKVVFGVGAKSANWESIIKSVYKQIDTYSLTVDFLEKLNSPEAAAARATYKKLDHETSLALIDAKANALVGGPILRDRILPQLIEETNVNRLTAKQTPIEVMVGNPPAPVKVFWTDIPNYERMSGADRAAAAQTIAEKTKRGMELLNAINPQNGAAPVPLPPMDRQQKRRAVTDLVFALKSRAQEKVGPYEKGGMTVPGGEALRAFFDSCGDDVYPRRSTHLQDQQELPGQSPRGMDFYDGAETLTNGDGDGLLPCGMNTVLLQQVTDTKGNKRMFIKMETASAFGTAGPKNKKDPQGIPGGGRTEKGSISEVISHGINVFRNTDAHKDLKGHRENTPKILFELCKKVVKQSSNTKATAELRSLMVKDQELQLRINKFMDKLDFWKPIAFTSPEAKEAIQDLEAELDEMFGAGADLSVQAGGEVALSAADLA